jgi:hypothetical protein
VGNVGCFGGCPVGRRPHDQAPSLCLMEGRREHAMKWGTVWALSPSFAPAGVGMIELLGSEFAEFEVARAAANQGELVAVVATVVVDRSLSMCSSQRSNRAFRVSVDETVVPVRTSMMKADGPSSQPAFWSRRRCVTSGGPRRFWGRS